LPLAKRAQPLNISGERSLPLAFAPSGAAALEAQDPPRAPSEIGYRLAAGAAEGAAKGAVFVLPSATLPSRRVTSKWACPAWSG
jgi:hypothetical protein